MVSVSDFYDRPVLFICKNEHEQKYLVVLEHRNEAREVWLYSPMTEETYTKLLAKEYDLKFAFLRAYRLTHIITFFDNRQSRHVHFQAHQLPDFLLPESKEYYG